MTVLYQLCAGVMHACTEGLDGKDRGICSRPKGLASPVSLLIPSHSFHIAPRLMTSIDPG